MDFTIISAPRMSLAGFRAVLERAASPAAPFAPRCYQAFVDAGVDPAVGLAVFQHESSYGRAGRATRNRSWGNTRYSSAYPAALVDGFTRYPSWVAGAADCARLLSVYGHNRIRPGVDTSTTQRFPYVWAPAADHNAPDRYGDAVTFAVNTWRLRYPVGTDPRPVADRPRTITVRAGDTLWSIAATRLGRGNRWPEIYALNRRIIGSDSSLIHAGQVLTLPRR